MEKRRIKVLMKREDFERMQEYIKLADEEISGFGEVRNVRDMSNGVSNFILVEKLHFPKQKNSAARSLSDEDMMIKFMQSLTDEQQRKIGFWWHSHVNMGATFSSIDEAAFRIWSWSPMLVSLVMNKRDEFSMQIDFYTPHAHATTDVELLVYKENFSLREECLLDMKNNVDGWTYEKSDYSYRDGYSNCKYAIHTILRDGKFVQEKEILDRKVKEAPVSTTSTNYKGYRSWYGPDGYNSNYGYDYENGYEYSYYKARNITPTKNETPKGFIGLPIIGVKSEITTETKPEVKTETKPETNYWKNQPKGKKSKNKISYENLTRLGRLNSEALPIFFEMINFKMSGITNEEMLNLSSLIYSYRSLIEDSVHLFKGDFGEEVLRNREFIARLLELKQGDRDYEELYSFAVDCVEEKIEFGDFLFTLLEDAVLSFLLGDDLFSFLSEHYRTHLKMMFYEHDSVITNATEEGNFRESSFGSKEKQCNVMKEITKFEEEMTKPEHVPEKEVQLWNS